jgi:hypothetical protein
LFEYSAIKPAAKKHMGARIKKHNAGPMLKLIRLHRKPTTHPNRESRKTQTKNQQTK